MLGSLARMRASFWLASAACEVDSGGGADVPSDTSELSGAECSGAEEPTEACEAACVMEVPSSDVASALPVSSEVMLRGVGADTAGWSASCVSACATA